MAVMRAEALKREAEMPDGPTRYLDYDSSVMDEL